MVKRYGAIISSEAEGHKGVAEVFVYYLRYYYYFIFIGPCKGDGAIVFKAVCCPYAAALFRIAKLGELYKSIFIYIERKGHYSVFLFVGEYSLVFVLEVKFKGFKSATALIALVGNSVYFVS